MKLHNLNINSILVLPLRRYIQPGQPLSQQNQPHTTILISIQFTHGTHRAICRSLHVSFVPFPVTQARLRDEEKWVTHQRQRSTFMACLLVRENIPHAISIFHLKESDCLMVPIQNDIKVAQEMF